MSAEWEGFVLVRGILLGCLLSIHLKSESKPLGLLEESIVRNVIGCFPSRMGVRGGGLGMEPETFRVWGDAPSR